MLRYMLTFCFLVLGPLYCNPIPTSFQELLDPRLLDQEIALRGFLYFNKNHWILAAEPNLKTCCLGVIQRSNSQIILDSNFDKLSINSIVLVQGTLSFEKGSFHLKNSRMLKDNKHHFFYTVMVLGILILLVVWIFRKTVRKT